MSTQSVPAVVLIGFKNEKENFEEKSRKELGYGWWRRLFNNSPVSIQVSTEITNLGVRAFCDLAAVPKPFDRILVPVIVDGKEVQLRLVVLKVAARGRISSRIVVRCAFDFGYTIEDMKICSHINIHGSVDEITSKWLMANANKIVETFKLKRGGRISGVETWVKQKTVPYEYSYP